MAVCPYCNTKDKPFFAQVCHACNNWVGFIEQLYTQIIWYILAPIIGTAILYAMGWIIWLTLA